jgi:hypothetical protein
VWAWAFVAEEGDLFGERWAAVLVVVLDHDRVASDHDDRAGAAAGELCGPCHVGHAHGADAEPAAASAGTVVGVVAHAAGLT